MERDRQGSGMAASLMLALALSLFTTLVIGGMLYYTLKRYEIAQVRQVEQTEQAGREQQAIVMSRLFANAGSGLIRTDLAKIQHMLLYEIGRAHV